MNKETVLLIEYEAGLRGFLQKYLSKKGYDVVVAKDGEEGLKKLGYKQPDIVLLDIDLPGIDGFEVCKRLRTQVTIPILFISYRKKVTDKIKCFQLGGDDYLIKPFDFSELEARIQANLRQYGRKCRLATTKSQVIRQGELVIDTERVHCLVEGEMVILPTKEMKLLLLLAKHPNRVLSAEHIYNQIWGFDYAGDANTVKVHISRLRSKLEKNPSKPKHILTVRGFGYLFEMQS